MKDQRGSAHLPIILALLFGSAVVVTIFGYMLWPKDSDTDTSAVVDVNKTRVNSNVKADVNTNAAVSNGNLNVNSNANSNNNTNTAVEPGIDDWKRYSNTALKYSFRYPTDLKSNECKVDGVPVYSFVSEDGVPCGTEWFGNGFGVAKQSSTYKEATSIQQTKDAIVNPVTSTVEIDGTSATRVRGVTKSGPDVMGGGNRYADYVFVMRSGVGYIINSLSVTNTAYRQADFNYFLDTIDFTD